MNDAMELANYIITKCIYDEEYISNLQLQKILYLVQIEFYKKLDRPAFTDDIQAWGFGPVVVDVYYKWCGFGAFRIGIAPKMTLPSKEERDIIDPIVERARKMNLWDLREMVCKEGGPWAKVYILPVYIEYPVIPAYLLANAEIDWTVS